MMANANRNYGSLILLVLAGEAVFFLPFVIPRIFRPSILSVYEISNTELGTYFSAYGIVAMISYIIGGPLADKFQPKNLLSLGLVLTALGGFALIIFPSIYGIGLYAYWGCSTILVFWAALIKSTRLWGGAHLQGKAFGFHPDPYPKQNLFYRSDNATLARLGVPAHSVSSDQIDKDPYYHTVDDEIETLDMEHLTQMIQAIAEGVQTLISGEDTPTRIEKEDKE